MTPCDHEDETPLIHCSRTGYTYCITLKVELSSNYSKKEYAAMPSVM